MNRIRSLWLSCIRSLMPSKLKLFKLSWKTEISIGLYTSPRNVWLRVVGWKWTKLYFFPGGRPWLLLESLLPVLYLCFYQGNHQTSQWQVWKQPRVSRGIEEKLIEEVKSWKKDKGSSFILTYHRNEFSYKGLHWEETKAEQKIKNKTREEN